jgi:hypothetical protein
MDTLFCNKDIGLYIISLTDINTTKRLYSLFPYFKVLLNSKYVLEYLRRVCGIISPANSFPEYYCQYIIKYNNDNTPFNKNFIIDTAIKNDDFHALLLTGSCHEPNIITKAFIYDKRNIISHIFKNPNIYQIFIDAYNGKINKTNNTHERLKMLSGLLCSDKY